MNNNQMTNTSVDIDLTLEEWGKIALIAHKNDMTINETILMLLEKYMKE